MTEEVKRWRKFSLNKKNSAEDWMKSASNFQTSLSRFPKYCEMLCGHYYKQNVPKDLC